MLLTIDISKILQYYAALCLTLLPLNFFIMIFISRRTNLLKRIDLLIDRIIPLKQEEQKEEKKKEENESSEAEPKEKPAPTEKEIQDMTGVAAFEILVGETYQCHLNYENRGGSFGEMTWSNDNEFVGKIKENGLFTGKKVGKTNVFCMTKGHSYDPGEQAYCISVVSKHGKWFADTLIEQIQSNKKESDIFTSNIHRKILFERPEKKVICYNSDLQNEYSELLLQYDESNVLARCVYKINENKDSNKRLLELLNERFEEIKLKSPAGVQIWIHQIIDDQHEEVDIYAFLYRNQTGTLWMGFGRNWRKFGEKQEFIDNIKLALRQFVDLTALPDTDPEASKEKPEKPAIKKKAASVNKKTKTKEKKKPEPTRTKDNPKQVNQEVDSESYEKTVEAEPAQEFFAGEEEYMKDIEDAAELENNEGEEDEEKNGQAYDEYPDIENL